MLVRDQRAIWGPNHPQTARYAINLAVKRAGLGDCASALTELAHARAVLAGVLPAESPDHLLITEAMGSCYGLQHAYDQALREHRARQTALIAAGRAGSVDMAGTWVDIGDVELDRKAYDDATASYRRALAVDEELLGKADARLGFPLSRLGESELAAGRIASARSALERALAIYTAAKVPPIVIADVWFPLARALWSQPAARSRATALAILARDAWSTGGAVHKARQAEAEAWLASHSAPAR